ncbi:AAA family ATPase [uncultured Friedmanniella sp.]|uniref:helix-turn-helix transcriptional regulator n=1 Tax=uncultured Friedmanniella sp. TaxID=335381 RepID=UPI0035CB6BA3
MPPLPAAVPLTGRDVELATLARLAGVTSPPAPGAVLLSGDAGIGKSRLLAALTAQAGEQSWRVATGHCLDLGGSPLPYLPFAEIAARLQANRPELMESLAGRWPAVRRLLPATAGSGAVDTLDRGAFFESIYAVLAALGREAPLLVVLEDLHWADRSTCDLVSYLFTRRFTVPVSLVASYRSDDLHRRHPLRSIAAGWSRLPGVRRLELAPLSDDQVRALVVALHPEPMAAAQLAAVVERAEGNAFFTEELVAAVGSHALPRDLAGLLLLRLDHLEPDAAQVVRAASAAGRSVRDRVLGAVTGLDQGRFEDAVRAAVEFHVLVAEDDGYRFRHSMLAEAVYEDLMPGERRRLHTAYVAALTGQTFPDGAPGTAADVARHAIAADDHATAYAASLRAGDEALAAQGPDEAARHYLLALDVAAADGSLTSGTADGLDEGAGIAARVAVTEKAVGALLAAGSLPRAESVAVGQLRSLPPTATPEQRGRLLVAVAESAVLTESGTDELAASSEAVQLVPADPPTALRARAVAIHAAALRGARREVEALRWVEEGLAMPPELRTGSVNASLHTTLARVSERGGDAATSRRVLTELHAAVRGADGPAEVRVLFQLASIEHEQGDLPQALATLRQAADRSTELGQPFAPYGSEARVQAALVAYQLGRWELVEELTGHLDDAPGLAAAGLLGIALGVRAARGRTAGWPALLERVRPYWPADGMIAVHSGAAAIDLHGPGELDEAVAVHDEVLACLRRAWHVDNPQARIRLTALLLGQLAAGLPSLPPGRRAELLEHAVEQAARAELAVGMGRRPERGAESNAWLLRLRAELGRLRRAAGEPVDVAAQATAWSEATAAFAAYGHRYEQARSAARWAMALRGTDDAGRAPSVAAAALETAQQLDAAPLVAELRPLVRPPSVEVLTPREREVLVLVAQGLSNREIGEQLYVSTKTASVHVSNILAKLSAHSRTEAAAVARRRGLID